MPARRIASGCFVGSCLLLVLGMFLWFDNPDVDVVASDLGTPGPAGKVTCSIAPWDAGLNDNDDGPGGEHARDYYDEVGAACYAANTTRFNAAVGSGVLALLLLGTGAAVAIRSAPTPPPTGRSQTGRSA